MTLNDYIGLLPAYSDTHIPGSCIADCVSQLPFLVLEVPLNFHVVFLPISWFCSLFLLQHLITVFMKNFLLPIWACRNLISSKSWCSFGEMGSRRNIWNLSTIHLSLFVNSSLFYLEILSPSTALRSWTSNGTDSTHKSRDRIQTHVWLIRTSYSLLQSSYFRERRVCVRKSETQEESRQILNFNILIIGYMISDFWNLYANGFLSFL